MENTFQYHQQIFAGLELEIYNDLLKKDKIFLQCIADLKILQVSKYIIFLLTNIIHQFKKEQIKSL